MLDIKKYFGRRSNKDVSDDATITKEDSLELRPNQPSTTSFNRKLTIGLIGFFAFVFIFSLAYGMSKSEPDKKKQEETVKNKKVEPTVQPSAHLEKLPSSYAEKAQNKGMSNGVNDASQQPPITDASRQVPQSVGSSARQSYQPYQPVNYSSPPIRSSGILQRYDSSSEYAMPSENSAVNSTANSKANATVNSAVNSAADKEEQEIAEARKSPIRFNLK